MSEPWARPSFPKHGNRSPKTLYASIGYALMEWENVEGECAHLYSMFTKDTQFSTEANLEYGVATNFKDRFKSLQEAACASFKKRPCQTIEGEFDHLFRLILGFSVRRNEIAHGRARPMHWIITPESNKTFLELAGKMEWCIIPAHFKGDRFTSDNMPVYLYSSREINAIAEHLRAITMRQINLLRYSEWRILPTQQRASHYKPTLPYVGKN